MLAAALALTLAAAACGDVGGDEATEDTVPPGPAPREPDEVGDGCGERAVTDTADLSPDRVVARCGPGAPETEPLAEGTALVVAVPPGAGEELAPVLLAERLGEFEAENLDVEIVERHPGEAMGALGAGELDVVVGPIGAPFFAAVHEGSGARVVLGGALTRSPNDLASPQAGMWLRRSAVEDDRDLADLTGQAVGLPGGRGAAALYQVERTLDQQAAPPQSVEIVDAGGDEAAERLRAGELAVAWLDGASWLPLADDSRFELVATLPATESIHGTVFSQRLTDDDREVGLAYARAVIRTVNTHLSGDYESDDEVVAALAEATGLDEDVVTATEPLLFDWEVRGGTLPRIEEAILELGGVAYDGAQPPTRFPDATLAAEAVGAPAR